MSPRARLAPAPPEVVPAFRIETTVATGTAAVRARPSRPLVPSIRWNGSARSDRGGQIRIAVPTEPSWGRSPRSPPAAPKGRRFSALGQSAHRDQGVFAPGGLSTFSTGPEPEGGPSQTTIACSDGGVSIVLIAAAPDIESFGPNPSRRPQVSTSRGEGERSQLIRRGGLRQWLGGRLEDSFHGLDRKETRASPAAPAGRTLNSSMIAVCSRRAVRRA